MSTTLCPSAQLIASTLKESPEAAFLLNTEGLVLYENPAGKRLIFETTEHGFDRTAGDPKHSYHFSFFFSFSSPTKPWQDCFDEILLQDSDTNSPRRFDVNDTGIHQDYDILCKRTNGTEFPASLRLATIGSCPCCHTAIAYLCAYVTPKVSFDIHNYPFAKEESALKCILNASFDPVFSIDELGTILMTNEAACRVFGYESPHELAGHNISKICGGGHAPKHDAYIRNYLDTGDAKIIGTQREVPAKRKDGTEFPVLLGVKEVSCEEYGMPKGKVVFVAFLKDLTEEKRHVQELKNKVDLMQGAINSSFDPMFQINQRGMIQNCNTAASALFGYSREEMIDHNISMICGNEHAFQHDHYLQEYLKTGVKKVIGRKRHVTARRKNGEEIEIELGVQEVIDTSTGERTYCGFIRDLTQQRMERRRQQRQQRSMQDDFFGTTGQANSATQKGRKKYDHSTTF
jgi:PAS domain S-box-containing protein